MRIMKQLRKNSINSFYQLKGIGVFAWIPLIVLYVMVPLVYYLIYYLDQDMEVLRDHIITNCQLYYPLLSVWHVWFVLYHYVEEPGNEILYVKGKSKLASILFFYFVYIVMLLPLFIVFTRLFSDLWWLNLKICVVSLLYVAVTYTISFLTKKIVVSVVVILLYTLLTILEYKTGKNNIGYYSDVIFVQKDCVKELVPIFIYAMLGLMTGKISNRYSTFYK